MASMWTYVQATGRLLHDGTLIGLAYSGRAEGHNNPDYQQVINSGPIPRGFYTIAPARDLAGGPHGPYVLPLEPDEDNLMFGRGGFLIHGDSIQAPGTASHGCIIAARVLREQIGKSLDRRLCVVKEDPTEVVA